MNELAVVTTLALGCLFLVSGAGKKARPDFTADLANYRVLPRRWVVPAAQALPLVEASIGAWLLSGVASRGALSCTAGLLVLLTGAVVVNLRRGRQIACACGGSGTTISWWLVGRNAILIGIALVAVYVGPDRSALASGDLAALVLAVVAGWMLLRLLVATRQISRAAWSRAGEGG